MVSSDKYRLLHARINYINVQIKNYDVLFKGGGEGILPQSFCIHSFLD